MAVGIKRQKPLNPFLSPSSGSGSGGGSGGGAFAVCEAVAFCGSTITHVASSSVIAEAVASSLGSLAYNSTGASVIAEAVAPPVWSNQWDSSGASVIAEAVFVDGTLEAGAGVDVYDEGILVMARATHIDIVGPDSRVDADGTGVKIFHPPPTYVSFYNSNSGTTTATVSDVTTSNRYVAAPTVEGTPFYSGGGVPWGGDGSTHPCTRTSPLVWATPQACSFINATTTFAVTISDSTGAIATYTTPAISGDGVNSGSNITVTISGWGADSDKFQAVVSVSVDINAILPNSGYFDIVIQHNDGADGTFTKTQ